MKGDGQDDVASKGKETPGERRKPPEIFFSLWNGVSS